MNVVCKVFVIDDKGFLFDAEEVIKVRKEQRICGQLVGTVKGFEHSLSQQGLPLELLKYELLLLYFKGIAEFYDVQINSQGKGIQSQEEQQIAEQESRFKRQRSSLQVSSWPQWKQDLYYQKAVQIPFLPQGGNLEDLQKVEIQINRFLIDKADLMRYLVFYDLYEQGYTLSDGTKFGADFLAYTGDPYIYHSVFGVRVYSVDKRIPLIFFTAAARCIHGARKYLLLAYVNIDKGVESADNIQQVLQDKLYKINYVTIAPEGQFQPKEQEVQEAKSDDD